MNAVGTTIESGAVRVDIDPDRGGRVTQIEVAGTPLLIGDRDPSPIAWGAYPMVPWAGRIRDGQFEFRGSRHQLPRNHGDHAMHGVGFSLPWTLVTLDPHAAELRLELPTDERWPFGGHVTQDIAVGHDRVELVMTVTAHDQAFPVSFGWHPWFRKPERLGFHPTAMFRRDADHITIDELIEVPAGPWDDCFVNRLPVTMTIDGVDVVATSPFEHWVVYDEPDHATCVEPQSGPPDAFNLEPAVLEPGDQLTGSYTLEFPAIEFPAI